MSRFAYSVYQGQKVSQNISEHRALLSYVAGETVHR